MCIALLHNLLYISLEIFACQYLPLLQVCIFANKEELICHILIKQQLDMQVNDKSSAQITGEEHK